MDNYDVILKPLEDAFGHPTQETVQHNLQSIYEQIRKAHNDIITQKTALEKHYTDAAMYQVGLYQKELKEVESAHIASDAEESTIQKAKGVVKDKYNAIIKKALTDEWFSYKSKYEEAIKTGYAITNLVRDGITNKHITYQIGLQYDNQLIESTLELKDFIKAIGLSQERWITSDPKNLFSFKGTMNKGSLKELLSKVELDNKAGPLISQGSTVWSGLYTYLHDRKAKRGSKQYNLGNGYEAYRYLMAQGYDNHGGALSPMTYYHAIRRVAKGTSGYEKGGDLNDVQIKSYIEHNFPVTSIQHVIDVLKIQEDMFEKLLNTHDIKPFKQTVYTNFIKPTNAVSKIEKAAYQALLDETNKRLQNVADVFTPAT